jgi:hypothetical protein
MKIYDAILIDYSENINNVVRVLKTNWIYFSKGYREGRYGFQGFYKKNGRGYGRSFS